jgi:signal-transduction protein with cAMP-binding, CBS, and nucleotidyltransferase domain
MNMHKINVITANYGNKPGIYTMGDFKRLLVESNFDLKQKLKLPITKFLNFEPVKIDINQCYEDAKLLFEKNNICHLVVTNNNESIGVLDIKCLK